MKIKLNGEGRYFPDGFSIDKMLEAIQVKSSITVVERNGEILDRSRYSEVHLKENDSIEVIRMVCGG